MRKTTILLGILGLISATPASAQLTELPEGPNRDLVLSHCRACHDLGMIFDADGISGQEWSNVVAAMTSYGANIAPDDRAKIIEYLTRYLGPAAKASR
jgi:hypothetical protein